MIGMHFTKEDTPPPKTDWVRLWDCGVTWKDIHTGPEAYDWSRLDALVDRYSDRQIVYVIAATPRWLAMDPNAPHPAPWLGRGSNSLPYDIEEFNKFVWNLSKRYKGRIKAYEVWNEPQLVDFMFPYTTSNLRRLATMTKRAYRTIKANDPQALVGSASILPRPTSGGMRRAKRYLKELKRAGWPFDFVSVHIYPEIGKGAKRWNWMLEETKKALRSVHSPVEKIWITETTYGLLGPEIPDDKARQLVQDTYRYAGSKFVFWYAWDRKDLGGMYIGPRSAAWEAIKEFG